MPYHNLKSFSAMANYEVFTPLYFGAYFHYQNSGEMPEHKTSIAPLHLAGSNKQFCNNGI